ncbi:hypothetical protein [Kitasatospora sp. A2-31]|uniref:hypothetical protein n=1 Tax=Kitasatospora sp. A2-31 TaxID=2916414 RepID=UPI001EEC57C1|nr:hypothetical protein [Kitasatospora sp. A2-31]MCG6495500.1 hypothetical protein [Kitasatospora sp. A2-31]
MNLLHGHSAAPAGGAVDAGPYPDDAQVAGGPAAGPDDPDGPAEASEEHAWDSRRDLYRHTPGILLGHSARLGGSLIGGDQHGVSGGHVTGDVILGGSKVEYHLGGDAEERSGEIPAAEVEALAVHFVYPAAPQDDAAGPDGPGDGAPGTGPVQGPAVDPGPGAWPPGSPFGVALAQLLEHRVAVISGPATTGRRSAAMMLLRAAGSTSYRALDPALTPGRLAGELREGCGHLLADFATGPERPLREHHLRGLSEKLRALDGHLVIVVGPHPVLHGGIGHVPWQPPEPAELLRGHLRGRDLAGHGVEELLDLPAVRSVLGHRRPVAELASFADRIAEYARGHLSLQGLAGFGHYAAEQQVREWFDSAEQSLHDKAFLIALAAFDEAPYPLTAELSDVLYGLLQRIEDPAEPARIPVFGTSSAQRVERAHADRYEEAEETEWGPVLQTKIQFRDRLTALTLLREVWIGHPSARPALVAWLRRLAVDPRPLVRTRAASTAAVLARTDLPSAMALLVRPWAADRRFRARLAAANALTLAHHLDTPHVPRILREWCTSDDHRLRWTAVRTYALVGDSFPGEAVTALVAAVRALEKRGKPAPGWPQELDELADSAASLLLAAGQGAPGRADGGSDGVRTARAGTGGSEPGADRSGAAPNAATDPVDGLWPTLLPLPPRGLHRDFVLRTVVYACGPTDGERGTGRPLLLDHFGRAERAPGTPGALLRQSVAGLLRAVLNDPTCSPSGLVALRRWVTAADTDPDAEQALADLLPMLAASVEDTRRLAYLLENLRGGPSDPVPSVAVRLRATLPGGAPVGAESAPRPSPVPSPRS